MAIIMRNGLEADFDPNKMRAGELAIVTDARELHATFAPGDSPKVLLDGEAVPSPETAGTEGQVLALDENGDPEWKSVAAPSDAQVEAAVTDWLDEHPEATTTVEDGAITYAKLDSNLKGTVDDVGELKSDIDTTGMAVTTSYGLNDFITSHKYIGTSTNKWASSNNVNSWNFAKPYNSRIMVIKGGLNSSFFTLLKSGDTMTVGDTPLYATGWSEVKRISSGEILFVELPDDCANIWIEKDNTNSGNSYIPAYLGFYYNPNNYIPLDYAESDGTQYVNTLVKLNQDCEVKITVQAVEADGTNYMFGGRTNTSSNAFGIGVASTKRLYVGYGAYNGVDFYPKNKIHVYDFKKNKLYADGELIYTADEATFETPQPAYLFATSGNVPDAVYYGKFRIYGCQIYDSNGDMIRDFIPMKRITDGAVIMYDRINKIEHVPSLPLKGGTELSGATVQNRIDIDNILDVLETPQYVETEADRVSKKVHNTQTGTSLTFVACSDLHYAVAVGSSADGVNVPDSQNALRDMANGIIGIASQTHIDFYACFGDVIYQWQSHGANYDNGVTEMYAVSKLIGKAFGNNPQIRMVGNHDPNCENSDGKEFSAYMMNSFTGIFSDMLTKNEGQPYGAYGYHDFDRQKVRFIVLNTSFYTPETDLPNAATRYYIGDEQAYWLCQALNLSDKADAESWQIVIASHVRLDDTTHAAQIGKYTNVINAYLTGGSWTGGAYSYDFSGKNAATISLYLNGHSHLYKFKNLLSVNSAGSVTGIFPVAQLYIPNALPGRDEESVDGVIYNKTANTAESTAFQIITIDFENKIVYAIHYGAGIDIVMHYAPTTNNSLSTALTEPVWNSVDTDVATVSNGVVTAVSNGYAMIYAKSEADNCIEVWNYQSIV